VAFRFDIPFDSALAHRGFSHSLAFALIVGAAAAAAARLLNAAPWTAFGFVSLAAASHGFLDALTDGGRGVMFFWPFDDERFFFPWRVILVSPIGIRGFISQYGLEVLQSEAIWVWLPASAMLLVVYALRRLTGRTI
jgi:inner membrane protein